jgi:hypothetical protein
MFDFHTEIDLLKNFISPLLMPAERLRTKESSRESSFSVPPSLDAETCYFFHKLLWNCLVAALIITKYVKSSGPPFALFISQLIEQELFALLDHVFMFIHYFIDTFFRSSDPSFS